DTAHEPFLHERPLLRTAAHLAPSFLAAAAAADDQLVGLLVLAARALAERRHAPRRPRMAAALRLPLAAAVRVVDGVHRGAAHGRPLAAPAAAPGLAAGDVLMVDVPDLADGRAARERDAAHLAGREPEHGESAVLRHELDAGAGGARHLGALAGLELDVVDERARRDVLERQRVADLDVGLGPRLDGRADPQLRRGEDVALRAVGVVEQRDPRRPVRVVLDRGDRRRHAVLDALEVDEPVAALVAAALVARRDPAVHVAAALLRERREQALLRLRLRDLLERRDGHEAAAGARALEVAAPLRLGLNLDDVHGHDLDVEELLDGLADLRLVRVLVDAERVAVLLDLLVALLGDDGADQDLGGMEAHALTPAFPSTSGSAASLTTSERAHTTCATSSSAGTVTSTRSRLRKLLMSASSSSVATSSVGVCWPHLSSSSTACFVDGASNESPATSPSVPACAWSLSAARSAARKAFLFTLTEKS